MDESIAPVKQIEEATKKTEVLEVEVLPPSPLELKFTVNKDGLTGEDLLLTLLRECALNGIYVAGVMIHKDTNNGIKLFGHSSTEFMLNAMKLGISSFSSPTATIVEQHHKQSEAN